MTLMHALQLYVPALKGALQCASKEETRYYLNGVCVVANMSEVIYVATDGHVLFAYRRDTQSTDNLAGTWIIPADIVAKLKLPSLKARNRAGHEYATLTDVGSGYLNLKCDADETSTTFKPIDGTFPDWRRVVPDGVDHDGNAKAQDIQFDPELLAKVWKPRRSWVAVGTRVAPRPPHRSVLAR
jgi:DNA polymerase III sliding clamp (beta) subunit (PCNA family)